MSLLDKMRPAVAHERKDKSVFLSFGDPFKGFHSQFDIYGPIDVAQEIARAVNCHSALVRTLEWTETAEIFSEDQPDNAFVMVSFATFKRMRAALSQAKSNGGEQP